MVSVRSQVLIEILNRLFLFRRNAIDLMRTRLLRRMQLKLLLLLNLSSYLISGQRVWVFFGLRNLYLLFWVLDRPRISQSLLFRRTPFWRLSSVACSRLKQQSISSLNNWSRYWVPRNEQGRFWTPTTKERAFSGTSPLPITQEGNSSHIIKGAIERWLKHQKRRLPKLMIEARTLSSQVPLIDHNDIVEMLHGPIYIKTETESPWY